ncbi:MAG: hypothetical protein PHP87_01940 [Syntrophomonas sp.]|uniref:hypothetical protein n=1 Tax=Syntrophomonas sp. TaxID=2053627 RepID=UPI002621A49D|nr:hypothetical protein [Syntrophomonas sp.]MDD4625838.1 hypothetical protein [Syntrophomonas sp.]
MDRDLGLDVFLTVSLNHPEINAVKYLADKEQLILEVALNGTIGIARRESFLKKTRDCLNLFHQLLGQKPGLMEVELIDKSELSFLRFYRDVGTLSQDEIGMLILLLREEFDNLLVKDNNDIVAKDAFKRKLKRSLMQKINRDSSNSTDFLAYRKEGRVFVFNR